MSESKGEELSRMGAGTLVSVFLTALAAASGVGAPLALAVFGVAGQLLGTLAMDSITRRGENYVSTLRRVMLEGHEGDFEAELRERSRIRTSGMSRTRRSFASATRSTTRSYLPSLC